MYEAGGDSTSHRYPEPLKLHQVRYQDDGPDHSQAGMPTRRGTVNDQMSPNLPPPRRTNTTTRAPGNKELSAGSTSFSPFPFYFRSKDLPTEKRGGKVLIGEKGWLQRTEQFQGPVSNERSSSKRAGILCGIKKMAKDIVADARSTPADTPVAPDTMPDISLDAREQSILYGELEFHLTDTLNEYITAQLDKGRLVPDRLKQVADGWKRCGHPRVVGFRYDLETQLALVALHIDHFIFSGRRRGNPAEIAELLRVAGDDARAMRTRTFCQPDVVIARHLVHARSLLNLLGVVGPAGVVLSEASHFFNVCVARERAAVARGTFRSRKSRVEHRRRCDERHLDDRTSSPGTQRDGQEDGCSIEDEWLFYPN